MKMQPGHTVHFWYTMKNASGEILEDNTNAAPVSFVFGTGDIDIELQEQMEGMEAGDRKTIILTQEGQTAFVFEVLVKEIGKSAAPPEKKMKELTVIPACGPGCDCK